MNLKTRLAGTCLAALTITGTAALAAPATHLAASHESTATPLVVALLLVAICSLALWRRNRTGRSFR